MIDEDLINLLRVLQQMDDRANVSIGWFNCHPLELKEVVSEALIYRAQRPKTEQGETK